ncbi:MAG: hypothetical protein ACRCZF_03305 [Gemmataceae bacterium]
MNPLPNPEPDRSRPHPQRPMMPATPPSLSLPTPAPQAPVGPLTGPGMAPGWAMRNWKMLAAAAALTLGIGVLWPKLAGPVESNHENFGLVREASARPKNELNWKKVDGSTVYGGILLSTTDRDDATTRAVQQALATGNEQQLQAALDAAQPPESKAPAARSVAIAPAVAPAAVPAPAQTLAPVLSPALRADLRSGQAEFYHVYLFDCCYEDGDIVEILVNGVPFRQVRLTNAGARLAIPVASDGSTRIQIRGVFDGGGSITVGCRTSQGRGFLRSMSEGEVEDLAIVKPRPGGTP